MSILSKALETNSKSEQLINLLQAFAEDNYDNQLDSNENDTSDKENADLSVLLLQNPKKHHGKGRPLNTKRFKSSNEVSNFKPKAQRQCKKCGKHHQHQDLEERCPDSHLYYFSDLTSKICKNITRRIENSDQLNLETLRKKDQFFDFNDEFNCEDMKQQDSF
ncbi:17308_t:CDS:2 [Funneliformis geosporum]|nr:17308_t:CDS:2 [Funneliformis geosporum]